MRQLPPLLLYVLVWLASFSLLGSGLYLVWELSFIVALASLIISLAILWLLRHYDVLPKLTAKDCLLTVNWHFSRLAYLFLYITAIVMLLQARTPLSINSPWQVVSPNFFIIYGLLTVILFWLIYHQQSRTLCLSLHYGLTLSVAVIVYIVGYGFDPFVHQAALSYISEYGAVLPKTVYYVGQYALEVMIHKLTALPLIGLDKLFLPILSAVFLPITAFQVFKTLWLDRRLSQLMVLSSLVLPLSWFIMTTPQGLGYFWLIIIVLLGLIAKERKDFILLYILALAALAAQPIAGIPALLLVVALHWSVTDLRFKKEGLSILIFLQAVTLPAIFYYLNKTQAVAQPVNDSTAVLGQVDWQLFSLPNLHSLWLNLVQLLQNNYWLLIIILIISGLIIVWRQTKNQPYMIYGLMASAGLLAYGLSSLLPFNFLINYDRDYYTQRLLFTSLILALPFIWQTWHWLLVRLNAQDRIIKVPLYLALAVIITTSCYLSYPRYDDYVKTRGPATAQVDLEAVSWIEQDANGQDYIVLANQQVGAAALRVLGFKNYYAGNLFYSIPTGAPLYQYYLDMINEPKLEIIATARQLTGVNLVYFVVNDYWEPYEKIVADTTNLASSTHSWGKQITVFRFDK
ncbi:MAG: hypothetical protein V1765_00830 [bacterium]